MNDYQHYLNRARIIKFPPILSKVDLDVLEIVKSLVSDHMVLTLEAIRERYSTRYSKPFDRTTLDNLPLRQVAPDLYSF